MIPTYRLILFKSPTIPLTEMIQAVQKVMRCSNHEAKDLATEARYHGSSVLCETHMERAEFLSDRLMPLSTVYIMQRPSTV